jgi:hypothetical protein
VRGCGGGGGAPSAARAAVIVTVSVLGVRNAGCWASSGSTSIASPGAPRCPSTAPRDMVLSSARCSPGGVRI